MLQWRVDGDSGASSPKQSSASRFPKDDWCVRRNLEISISFLDPVLLLSVHCGHKNTSPLSDRPEDRSLTSAGNWWADWKRCRGLAVEGVSTRSLPWFTSFSSSSMGLMRVLGQNSSRAWSSSPPRFTTEGEVVRKVSSDAMFCQLRSA